MSVEDFASMLAEGGKKNSLGRAEEIVQIVLAQHGRLDELYRCLFEDDAWVRMRAIDAFEKICRIHPDWIEAYVDRLLSEVASNTQASIQWHLAEIFAAVQLSERQYDRAVVLMKQNISQTTVDWIVAANTMKALAHFTEQERFSVSELIPLLRIQTHHASRAVVKRATVLLDQFGDKGSIINS